MATVEFFYDVASSYSYLAATQIEAIAADCGARLVWRPFLLGGVFKATGNAPPAFLPARARYLLTDLARWSAHQGVSLTVPPSFPPNSLLAMRALTSLPEETLPGASLALFHAYWVHGESIEDPEVLSRVLGADAVQAAADPAVKERLRATTEEAVSRGAFGAPTFFVGSEMFFGNDRLPFVEQALRRRP